MKETQKWKNETVTFLSVKTEELPQEKLQMRHTWERECRYIICDNYEQSQVYSPYLPIHLCSHMSFSPSLFLHELPGKQLRINFTRTATKKACLVLSYV